MSNNLSDHVVLTITQDFLGIARAGFGIPAILSCKTLWTERVRFYTDLPGLTTDGFATTSPEYLAAEAIFSQDPHPDQIAILRAVGQPTQRYQINISTVAAGSTYRVYVKGEGVTATTVQYIPGADLTVSAVTNGADSLTVVAHGMATGDGPYRVSNSGGGLPAGLAVDTDYWVIKLTADTFSLASSKANAIALTAINLTSDGTGVQTIRRAENDVICAQLVQGLNAVVGKNYLATQTTGAGETDYVVVTGSAPGNWFSLQVSSIALMKIAQTHAEPSPALATDLDAILLENSDWYFLYTFFNSDGVVKPTAAWAQAQVLQYMADISDSETATLTASAGDTDLANDMHNLADDRVETVYCSDPSAMRGAAWLGTRACLEPGSETWKFASPAGQTPDVLTSTHAVNLRAKKCNALQTVGGVNIMWEGTTTDGGFIDTRRNLDWMKDDMTKGVFGAMAAALKIPFTDPGIAVVQNEVEASLQRAEDRGIIAPGWKVTVPLAKDVSTSNKALRILPDVKFTAVLQGAVHRVTMSGTVSV